MDERRSPETASKVHKVIRKVCLCSFLFLAFATLLSPAQENTQEILKAILKRAEENQTSAEKYGFVNKILVRRLTEDGKVKSQESRKYRTVWIEDLPYAELIEMNGKLLDTKQKAEEEKRKKEFLKHRKKAKEDDPDEISWQDLYEKYDFALQPSEPGVPYVISFRPKTGKLKEQSRIEKIFNHLGGTLWVDEQFNILRAEANLTETVRFGLGILAKVDQLEIRYVQQQFQSVWLPGTLEFNLQARFALVRTERQETSSRFYDIYAKPPAM